MPEVQATLVQKVSRVVPTEDGRHLLVFGEIGGKPAALAFDAADLLRAVEALAEARRARRLAEGIEAGGDAGAAKSVERSEASDLSPPTMVAGRRGGRDCAGTSA